MRNRSAAIYARFPRIFLFSAQLYCLPASGRKYSHGKYLPLPAGRRAKLNLDSLIPCMHWAAGNLSLYPFKNYDNFNLCIMHYHCYQHVKVSQSR